MKLIYSKTLPPLPPMKTAVNEIIKLPQTSKIVNSNGFISSDSSKYAFTMSTFERWKLACVAVVSFLFSGGESEQTSAPGVSKK